MAIEPDILESPAAVLLLELEKRGCVCVATETGGLRVSPASRLTEVDRQAIVQLKHDRIDVLKCCDDGVGARRDEFRRQIDRSSETNTIPTFIFVEGIPYREGACFSCGDEFVQLEVSRCWRCSLAMRLALWGAGLYAPTSALDQARIA
jgi:hypothetical protein